MIIDCHGHVSAPTELWAYKSSVLAHRGSHGRGGVRVTDDQIRAAANKKEMAPCGHLDMLHKHGTDLQLISPRPFQMMASYEPARAVHWFAEECNKIIHRNVELFPDKFVGICGLPQVAGEPIENTLPELDRCVSLGFKGCLLNPDPYENTGTHPPGLGERYWYPLYEKLCELDLSRRTFTATGSRSGALALFGAFHQRGNHRRVYNLVNSNVFKPTFPNLKIVVSHGGGAIPYQIGRFIAGNIYSGKDFRKNFRKLYFDTVLYTEGALRLLIETVGAEHCLFGSECPGVGSQYDPESGQQERTMDDIAPTIARFDWLSDAEKKMIFEDNARRVFKLDV